ncbi:MAG: anti-sigma factor ChrR (cupin superfamily) [Polyangiales bacterium]|jgi:anti-sigma factor ChrR (cupin superfamily)
MELNADFSKRVVIHSHDVPWSPSPIAGVDRRMLDRIGDEVARATSIVRYAPGSHFSPHVHTGGEEFIVLEGVFQDEHGDYPVGSYVRNPPTSKHTPGAAEGCVIFVKLWQFDPDDRSPVRTDMSKGLEATEREGVKARELFEDDRETVVIEEWAPGAEVQIVMPEGAEYLVLEGTFHEGDDVLKTHSWLRIPMGGTLNAKAGSDGARVWIKTRHLRFTEAPSV